MAVTWAWKGSVDYIWHFNTLSFGLVPPCPHPAAVTIAEVLNGVCDQSELHGQVNGSHHGTH